MRGRGLTILVFAFAAREVPVLAVLVILVGGLAGHMEVWRNERAKDLSTS